MGDGSDDFSKDMDQVKDLFFKRPRRAGGLKSGQKRRAKDSRRRGPGDRRKAKPLSRERRWIDAAAVAVAALQDLKDIQSEFEDWKDNLSENLQGSALGEKLDTICNIDIESAVSAAEEAEGADVPLGYGRD